MIIYHKVKYLKTNSSGIKSLVLKTYFKVEIHFFSSFFNNINFCIFLKQQKIFIYFKHNYFQQIKFT